MSSVNNIKETNEYKLCIYELQFKEYILQFPDNIFIYDDKTLESKKYYDLIVGERQIIFDENSKLIKDFYDIDAILLKLYTNKMFKNFTGSTLILKNILNSKLIEKIINFKYYILKTETIKREDIILKIDNSIIVDILSELKSVCDLILIINNESKSNDNVKIVNFCLYIFEKHFKILFKICKDDINKIINLNTNSLPIGKKNIKTTIDIILNNAIEYKEKINKLTSN